MEYYNLFSENSVHKKMEYQTMLYRREKNTKLFRQYASNIYIYIIYLVYMCIHTYIGKI